jgi:hypothetical protein
MYTLRFCMYKIMFIRHSSRLKQYVSIIFLNQGLGEALLKYSPTISIVSLQSYEYHSFSST